MTHKPKTFFGYGRESLHDDGSPLRQTKKERKENNSYSESMTETSHLKENL